MRLNINVTKGMKELVERVGAERGHSGISETVRRAVMLYAEVHDRINEGYEPRLRASDKPDVELHLF